MFNHLVFLAILVTNDGLQSETEVEPQADASSPLLSLKISTVVIFPIFFSGHVSLRKREASVALRLDRTPAQCGKEDFDATQISHWLLLLILPLSRVRVVVAAVVIHGRTWCNDSTKHNHCTREFYESRDMSIKGGTILE